LKYIWHNDDYIAQVFRLDLDLHERISF
jgi:hypothetical protein